MESRFFTMVLRCLLFVIAGSTSSVEAQVADAFPEFSRQESLQRLQQKIAAVQPLVVHAMIALCDNEHQGIVPVNERLGDGANPRTNLYWGALYGVSHHFGRAESWQLLETQENVSAVVLERKIFSRVMPNGTRVILVADAYRGDAMKACLVDFFDAVSGRKSEEVRVVKDAFGIFGAADLIVFNGHNGLMDYYNLRFLRSADQLPREVAVIGCASEGYFNPHLKIAGGYPLLMTTNLMAPEAYVMEALVNNWALGKDGETIRKSVGAAYHKYQKCGLNGATSLFSTGW